MLQSVRPEDLDVGLQFQVDVLGTTSLGQATSADLAFVQKPLRDMYFAYQKPTGPQPLPACSIVVSNRGLAVSDASNQGGIPAPETLYNIPSVVFAAAVRFVNFGKKEKDFKCAFEAIEADQHPKGRDDLFVALDKKCRHLAKIASHPALCVCVIQRMTGIKALEMHVFVCQSDAQARDVIFCLTSASRNFAAAKEPPASAIYDGFGVYDFGRPVAGLGGPGLANGADNNMAKSGLQRNGSGGAAMGGGGGDGVYGGYQRYPDQTQMVKPVGGMMEPGPWGEAPSAAGGGWLSQQKQQLMQNFNDDQRKYEMQQRVGPPGQGIYDVHPPVYEFRGPSPQTESNVYGLRKDLYDPPPPNEPQNVYGQGRMMSDSYEALKSKESEEQSNKFLIPRSQVNYDAGLSGRQSPLPGSASPMRPSSFAFDPAKQPPPSESTIDRKAKSGKVPPPTPAAKKQLNSPTSSLTGAGDPVYNEHPVPHNNDTRVPRKVPGIKVFPTIMLNRNQVAKAAAASQDEDSVEPRLPSQMAESSRLARQAAASGPDDRGGGTGRSRKEEEIESAMGGLTLDHGRSALNSNDFEQSLGYFP